MRLPFTIVKVAAHMLWKVLTCPLARLYYPCWPSLFGLLVCRFQQPAIWRGFSGLLAEGDLIAYRAIRAVSLSTPNPLLSQCSAFLNGEGATAPNAGLVSRPGLCRNVTVNNQANKACYHLGRMLPNCKARCAPENRLPSDSKTMRERISSINFLTIA